MLPKPALPWEKSMHPVRNRRSSVRERTLMSCKGKRREGLMFFPGENALTALFVQSFFRSPSYRPPLFSTKLSRRTKVMENNRKCAKRNENLGSSKIRWNSEKSLLTCQPIPIVHPFLLPFIPRDPLHVPPFLRNRFVSFRK